MINFLVLILGGLLLDHTFTHEVLHLNNESEYFQTGAQNPHFVVALYNSEANPQSERIVEEMLTKFSKDSNFAKNNFKFAKIDFKNIEILIKHYEIIGNAALYYYIGNQLQTFKEFGTLVDDFTDGKIQKNTLYEKAHSFIFEKFTRIARILTNEVELEAVLDNRKIVAVYFSDGKTKNEKKFDHLALKRIHFDFFKILKPDLAQKIYYDKTGTDLGDREVFAILRHNSAIDEHDNQKLVGIDANLPAEIYRYFFTYESKPKIMTEHYGHDIFMGVMHKKAKLVLYTYGSTTPDSEKQAFLGAVKRINKGFFFAIGNIDGNLIGTFHQIFLNSNDDKKMIVDKIYLIQAHALKFDIVEIMVSEKENEEAVYMAIIKAYRQKNEWFKKSEKFIIDGPEHESHQIDEL